MQTKSSDQPLIELTDIRFFWPQSKRPVIDLQQLSFYKTENVFIRGASGSGKSTLLNIIGGVLPVQQGTVRVLGHNISQLSAAARDKLRANHIGFIFQQFNLIPYLSILENVVLPCRFSRIRSDRSIKRSGSVESEARYLLSHLYGDSGPDLNQRATDLSVGQQQRVAAARALMGQPELIIADEPTSSLDIDTRQVFMKLLFEEVKHSNSTLLFVSHDPAHQALFDSCMSMNSINHTSRVVV
ncbi:MAG: ABC transporter ATP-binding protein [Gammaproteobacteria bacterium]|nr:ABC transporter ATP-binding protein [Gammaproteobacteria bacterium]